MDDRYKDSFVVDGKLALPYQYFAGRTGSRFITTIRDEKKIMGLRCEGCGKVFMPPRSTCERCFVDISDNWVAVKHTGTVTGFTIIRYKEPYQPFDPPYIQALIQLDGADTPLVHIVKGIPASQIHKGLRVKAVFAKKTTTTIMDIDHFRPEVKDSVKLGYTYDQLEIGMSASFSKTISETDVYLFAGISGDFNPMHMNENFARQTPFGTRIAHGALPQCLCAPVLGMKLPGLGTAKGFEGHADDPETFYSFESFATPETIYALDVTTGASRLFHEPRVDFDASGLETEQVFFTSQDGTRVPMLNAFRSLIRMTCSP